MDGPHNLSLLSLVIAALLARKGERGGRVCERGQRGKQDPSARSSTPHASCAPSCTLTSVHSPPSSSVCIAAGGRTLHHTLFLVSEV